MATQKAAQPAEDRISVTIPADLKKAYKIACTIDGLEMAAHIRGMIEKWLQERSRKK